MNQELYLDLIILFKEKHLMFLEIEIINLYQIIIKLQLYQILIHVIMVIGIMIELHHSFIFVYLVNKEFNLNL